MANNSDNPTYYNWHGETGPVVVLIHGLGLNQAMWKFQLPALSKSYRVLTYDLCGHGQSAVFPGTPDLTMFSDQLAQLLEECNVEACAVIGFSIGGMICRRFAMDYPERVSAAGILASAHTRSPDAQDAILARVEQAKQDGPAATIEAALVRWFGDEFRTANPETMDQVRQWVLANNANTYPGYYNVLATGVDELVAPTPAISCPALVMTGEEDYGNSPEMSEAISAEISGSELVILKGLRHMAMMENPDVFNEKLLSFLNRVYE